jgi:hypothetical protein
VIPPEEEVPENYKVIELMSGNKLIFSTKSKNLPIIGSELAEYGVCLEK